MALVSASLASRVNPRSLAGELEQSFTLGHFAGERVSSFEPLNDAGLNED